MQNTNNKLRPSLTSGLAKGWNGFVWMLKILERLHLSMGINHSMIEDPALFLSLGLSIFWMCVPRVAAAIIAVQLLIIFKRFISLPDFSKFSLWHNK